MKDYKSLWAAVTNCATLVNIQTDSIWAVYMKSSSSWGKNTMILQWPEYLCARMESTSSAKPMSNIRSTSSSTTWFSCDRSRQPRSRRSLIRPGVPTNTSTPERRLRSETHQPTVNLTLCDTQCSKKQQQYLSVTVTCRDNAYKFFFYDDLKHCKVGQVDLVLASNENSSVGHRMKDYKSLFCQLPKTKKYAFLSNLPKPQNLGF